MSARRRRITMVCTGNAARSVMAALLLRDRLGDDGPFEIGSAGTLVIPDQPMSVRTRNALARHGLEDPYHRSRQVTTNDVDASAVLLVMEPSHVHWMRRRLPEALPIAGMLRKVTRDLPAMAGTTLDERIAALDLANHEVEPWEEVVDPGSGQQDAFDTCIDDLAELVDRLADTLRGLDG